MTLETNINPDAIQQVNPFNRPIPGQSLTSNPDEPYPWEKPPEISNFKEALDRTVADILEPDNFLKIAVALGDGMPIRSLVSMFSKAPVFMGKWNMDMALQMVEPLTYVFLGIAEKVGIDPILESREEDSDILMDDEVVLDETKKRNKVVRDSLFDNVVDEGVKKPKTNLPPVIQQALDDYQVTEEQQSLLARNEGVV